MKYGELNLGQIEAVVNKLGGMEGVKRFLSGETVATAPVRTWSTWKTLKLGTGLKTADDFRKALKASGFRIGDWANDVLGKPKFAVSGVEREVELVKVTVKELTGKDRATRAEIYRVAKEKGLELCPAEVGPQLRLQYQDQPYGEWLVIAMEPITDSVGNLEVFDVRHGAGGRWLGGRFGGPELVWYSVLRFVFRK